ncbi:hypothetical protein CHUAL_005098 [Chamberlinius hualienensis]
MRIMSRKMKRPNAPRRSYSLRKVRELCLQEVSNLDADYHIIQLIGEGSYGQVHLAEDRQTGFKIALKAVSKDHTKQKDFLQEFHYSYFLSPHVNILNSYDVAFQTDTHFIFAQEYAPFGDLARRLDQKNLPLTETQVKSVCRQLTSALEFMHSKDLVHRDLRPHNVLIFESDLSVVKLTDFGITRTSGTLVKKTNVCLAYMPPEICEAVYNEGYTVHTSSDVWQLAILVLVCLSRMLPWESADITDPDYTEFLKWHKRKTTKTPSVLRPYTPRFQRMVRRMLEPKIEGRAEVKEPLKYMNDKWIQAKNSAGFLEFGSKSNNPFDSKAEKGNNWSGDNCNDNVIIRHLNNFKEKHSSLRKLLTSYGIETTIDCESKNKRIQDWLLATSVNH